MNETSTYRPVVEALSAEQTYRECSASELGFATTADVVRSGTIVGQERARRALEMGTRIRGTGFNLYVLGPPGSSRHEMVRQFLRAEAAQRQPADDWCYVYNFDDPRKPQGLSLPPGRGTRLSIDMRQLVDDLSASLPAAFESDSYRNRITEIEQDFQRRGREELEALQKEAEQQGMGLLPTPQGFAIAPVRDGEVIAEEDFQKWPKADQEKARASIEALSAKLRKHFENMPMWQKEHRRRVRELDRETALLAVTALIRELSEKYEDLARVVEHLDRVQTDILENVRHFLTPESEGDVMAEQMGMTREHWLRRYQVNVLVDNRRLSGAPVVYESNPTHDNLVGRIEHVTRFGTLSTDFSMILPGALQTANGGFLVLDAERLLQQPMAWESLKRALYGGAVRIESLAQILGVISTEGLDPDPMPLDVKIVLVGTRMLYYLLCEYDLDFPELFKVAADFEDHIDRNPANTRLYAAMLGGIAQARGLLALDAGAIARVIEYSARISEDSTRLTTRLRNLGDLMCEADYQCRQRSGAVISVADITSAINARITRMDRVRSNIYEAIERGEILIDTEGFTVGQINALSVMQLGDFSFGQPSRITATVRIGEGDVIDVEREVELGGAIHSKGVLILSSFVGARYARTSPLSLQSSLVFEQHYGSIDGDSASMAELCALLSALAELPINQALAVTGSVNQLGRAQTIGGVNEKIEGFFDVCKRRGLRQGQGVIIPAENVPHLMLDNRVRAAIRQHQFAIYPVRTVDEALSLLMGVDAGSVDAEGVYPADSINGRVQQALAELADKRQEFSKGSGDDGSESDQA
ncbi:MAG: AAA family ATPase [Chromatiales bacterium]|nr:AAA family ATPase [Chromatiales bacterium]